MSPSSSAGSAGAPVAFVQAQDEPRASPFRLARVAAACVAAAGCRTRQQVVDETQADAVHTARRRGAFELDCPAAQAEVPGKEMIQAPIMNPRFAPPQRAESTVGVSGCGQRATCMVVRAEGGTGCVAGGARNVVRRVRAIVTCRLAA